MIRWSRIHYLLCFAKETDCGEVSQEPQQPGDRGPDPHQRVQRTRGLIHLKNNEIYYRFLCFSL